MTTLYLDHSIIAREEHWPPVRALVSKASPPQVVASDWNLVEIAQGSDRTQAMRRADFISALMPHWAVSRLHVQRAELRNFLERTYWRTHPTPFQSITPSFAVMMSYNTGPNVPIGWGPREYVANLHDNPAYLREIEALKTSCVESLRTQQAAGKRARHAIEPTVLRHWVTEKLPIEKPGGRFLTITEKQAAAEHCLANANDLFRSSPAVAVESALSEVRARDARRQAESQDAIDFQHAVVALAYCDKFAVRDGYLLHCARETAKMLSPMNVAQAGSLDELFEASIAV